MVQAQAVQRLDASDNQLSDFSVSRLIKLPELRVIGLRNNRLSALPLTAHSSVPTMALDVSGNNIRSLVRVPALHTHACMQTKA